MDGHTQQELLEKHHYSRVHFNMEEEENQTTEAEEAETEAAEEAEDDSEKVNDEEDSE